MRCEVSQLCSKQTFNHPGHVSPLMRHRNLSDLRLPFLKYKLRTANTRAVASRTATQSHTDPLGSACMKWSAANREAKPSRKPVCRPLMNRPTYCTSMVIKPNRSPANTATPEKNNFTSATKRGFSKWQLQEKNYEHWIVDA